MTEEEFMQKSADALKRLNEMDSTMDIIRARLAQPKRDFQFSTIEEAMQPMPIQQIPEGQPQLTDKETQFAKAFTVLLKAGYGKEAETILKCKCEWVDLTATEIKLLRRAAANDREFAELVQAKLKEKNT